MGDLISRAAAKRAINDYKNSMIGLAPLEINRIVDIFQIIQKQPAVDAVPVVRAGAELTDTELIEEIWKAPIVLKPNVDAVPVVRCRDCKYYDRRCFTCENDVLLIKIDDCGCHPPFRVDDDWYCADGERRDDDGSAD